MTTTSLIGALAPSADPSTVREIAIGAARDAMATRMIVDAADQGNPHAAAFADEAQHILGAAQVRRLRARRLRDASARAAMGGYSEVSRWGAEAAAKETRAAERLEAAVVQGVRHSHSPGAFGYISPEEQRLLGQKSAMEAMTQAQLEQTFAQLLTQIRGDADNFGADGDDDEELGGCKAIDQLGVAAALYGGDLPAVFGSDVYAETFGLFKPSATRLRKRLARKKAKLVKVEDKLESLEDAGKKGLNVKLLRMRVKKLEKAIARIRGKLKKLDGAEIQTKKSARKAKKVARAETQVVKEATSDDDTDDVDDEEADAELAAAVEVFGLAPRRARRIRSRVRRLRRRAGGARGRRRRRLMSRARRLRGRLDPRWRRRRLRRLVTTPVAPYPAPYPVDQGYVPVAVPVYDDEEPEEEVEEEIEEDERMGLQLDPSDDAAGRDALMGFFAERAAVFGANDLDPNDTVTFGKGFFEATGDWFRNLWTGGKAKVAARKSATQRARAAREPFKPGIALTRKELRAQHEAQRQAARAARKGASGAGAQARLVQGSGGYVYKQWSNGDIAIVEGALPAGWTRGRPGPRQSAAWVAINQELSGGAPPSARRRSGHDAATLALRDAAGPAEGDVRARSRSREMQPGDNVLDFVGADLVSVMAPALGAAAAGPGIFEQLATPTTQRERVRVLAQHLDKAVKTFGPKAEATQELSDQLVEAKKAGLEEGPDAPLDDDDLDELDEDLAFAFGAAQDDLDEMGLGGRGRERRGQRIRARRGRRLRRLQQRAARQESRGHSRRAERLRRKARRRIQRWTNRRERMDARHARRLGLDDDADLAYG